MEVNNKIGECPRAHKYLAFNFMSSMIYQSKVMTFIDHLRRDEWTHHNKVKTHYSGFFGSHSGSFFLVSQILLHYIKIYLRNLAKVKWKIETYILIFQIYLFFTKRINVQFKVDFTKDGTFNVTIETTPKKLSLWIFFF
jgi:hypothetical protein